MEHQFLVQCQLHVEGEELQGQVQVVGCNRACSADRDKKPARVVFCMEPTRWIL